MFPALLLLLSHAMQPSPARWVTPSAANPPTPTAPAALLSVQNQLTTCETGRVRRTQICRSRLLLLLRIATLQEVQARGHSVGTHLTACSPHGLTPWHNVCGMLAHSVPCTLSWCGAHGCSVGHCAVGTPYGVRAQCCCVSAGLLARRLRIQHGVRWDRRHFACWLPAPTARYFLFLSTR